MVHIFNLVLTLCEQSGEGRLAHPLPAASSKLDIPVRVCSPGASASADPKASAGPVFWLGICGSMNEFGDAAPSIFLGTAGSQRVPQNESTQAQVPRPGVWTEVRLSTLRAVCLGAITHSFSRYIKPPVTVRDTLCLSLVTDQRTLNLQTESESDLRLFFSQLHVEVMRAGMTMSAGRLSEDVYPDETVSCLCSTSRVESLHSRSTVLLRYKEPEAFGWAHQMSKQTVRGLVPVLDWRVPDIFQRVPLPEKPLFRQLLQPQQQQPQPASKFMPALNASISAELASPDRWYALSMAPAHTQWEQAVSGAAGGSSNHNAPPPINVGDQKLELKQQQQQPSHSPAWTPNAPSPASAPAAGVWPDAFDARLNTTQFSVVFELKAFGASSLEAKLAGPAPPPNPNVAAPDLVLLAMQTRDGSSSLLISVPNLSTGQLQIAARHADHHATGRVQPQHDPERFRFAGTRRFVIVVAEWNAPHQTPAPNDQTLLQTMRDAAPGTRVCYVYMSGQLLGWCALPYEFPDLSKLSMQVCPRGYLGYLKFVAVYRYALPAPLALAMVSGSMGLQLEYIEQLVGEPRATSQLVRCVGFLLDPQMIDCFVSCVCP